MTADWHKLETAGYVVVREFLSADAVAVLADDFDRGAPPERYPHGFKLIGRRAIAAVLPRIESVLAEVRAATSVRADAVSFLTLSHFITTRLVARTSHLHQDFDLDYRLTRDHINYLNFWIPVRKPDPARSNVCVIPFDALAARSPSADAALRGSGGHRLVSRDGATDVLGNYGEVLDDGPAPAPELVLDFDVEEIAVTPHLAAGDLLLMRGDLIHRTQDDATDRLAASIRATDSRKRIARDRIGDAAAGDPAAPIFAIVERCFAASSRDEITVAELSEFARGARPAGP